LNRAGHHHADYDLRFQSLINTLSTLQTTFHHIRQQENNSDVLFQLKVNSFSFIFDLLFFLFLQNFKIERDDFDEEIRRLSYTNEQIISETSIEGSEHLKLKFKQIQTKWRTFNNDIQSFEVNLFLSFSIISLKSFQDKLAQYDEEQRLVLNEQATIEQTLTTIQQQLQTFDQQYLNDYTSSDAVRQRLQQMSNTLSSVEKFHLHLLSPTSSTDSTVMERAQQLSSFHDQLKSSTEVKHRNFFFFLHNFCFIVEKNERIKSIGKIFQ
jgi:hypothetical protein